MSIEVTDYIDVEQRAGELGIKTPEGFCILPRRFQHAKGVEAMCHEASALDLKVLFRQENLPIEVYQPEGKPIPLIKENDNTWIGPGPLRELRSLYPEPARPERRAQRHRELRDRSLQGLS
jgi:hypothetical protein